MRHLKQSILFLAIALIANVAIAQKTIKFPKSISFIKMTAPGVAIVGTDDALYAIDKTGKEIWKDTKLKKIKESQVEILEGSELIYIASFRGFHLINVLTGVHYGTDVGTVYGARVIHGTNQVWVIGKYNSIHVYDIATNTKLYKFEPNLPFKLSSSNQTDSQSKNFIGVQPITYTGKNTAILHIGLGQLGKYNLQTGSTIWEFDWKPYKIKKPNGDKGDRPSNPGKGWAMMQLDDSTNTLYFPFRNKLIAVDTKTGKSKWDIKANKVTQINNLFVTDDGIVVHTSKGIELINKETGMLKWEKPIKIKGSGGLLINDNGTFYIVAKKTVEKIDIANKKSIPLTEKIKFQGGESFSDLEIIDDIVVLSGSQNVIGVNKSSGETIFSTYYKSPGVGIGGIAKGIALTGVAMASTMNSHRINSQAGNKHYNIYTPNMRSVYGDGVTTDTGNHLYIITKFKDNDAKGFGIAKVDKKTGATTAKVVIGDRDPIYAVDENNDILFYKSDKQVLNIKSVK